MPRGEEKGGEKWMTDQPTNTVLLRGLATNIDEKDVSFSRGDRLLQRSCNAM